MRSIRIKKDEGNAEDKSKRVKMKNIKQAHKKEVPWPNHSLVRPTLRNSEWTNMSHTSNSEWTNM